LPEKPKIAIIAAIEREVWPLVRRWRVAKHTYDGRNFKFFEQEEKVVVCGGIGGDAGRRATEAVIQLYHPRLLISAGFAGALDPKLRVGNIVVPAFVIDGDDGSRFETRSGKGTLVSSPSIAGSGQKAKLAKKYGADAVDMEGAAVGRGAHSHGIPFMAVKSLSDEFGFELPPMQQFVDPSGRFRVLAFAAFVAFRPWLWIKTFTLSKNSMAASESLCRWLEQYKHDPQKMENSAAGLHPIEGSPRPATIRR
jgi:adenosylhomocysteine nucleosidase